MGETKIQWATYVFNRWWGCTEVSEACDNCYARIFANRIRGMQWGAGAPRIPCSESYRQKPYAWNEAARKANERRRVFGGSMMDPLDHEVPREWREDLWKIAEETEHLDWLFLTKRIGNAPRMIPDRWIARPPRNVWWLISVGRQFELDRDAPKLLSLPFDVLGVSYEPALELVDFSSYLWLAARGKGWKEVKATAAYGDPRRRLSWIIVGGESGMEARPFNPDWARVVIAQCRAAGKAAFVKQLGTRWARNYSARDWHGGDPSEWPPDLRVREFPKVAA